MGIYLIGRDGTEELLIEGNLSLFDPQIVGPRFKPNTIPTMRNHDDKNGRFYVQNVYEGTHMRGVGKGAVKYLRVIESPEKRTWTARGWFGQGEQAPAVNWHSFENKQIIGDVPVEEDGSASFEAPAGKKAPQKLTGWQNKAPVKFSYLEQVQPILDRHCVKCHDFDQDNREKLVLAKDKNPFFNASYVNLYVKKAISLIGGGPAAIQEAYSWGSHPSKLTRLIDSNHKGVNLTKKEKEVLYTWMDLNGVYYPVYESAFDSTLAGRSPLTDNEIHTLTKLTGVNLFELNKFDRQQTAQVSFDRPELSPCLDSIRKDKEAYKQAVAIIRLGQKRMRNTPRGDLEKELVPCHRNKAQLRHYAERLEAV